MAGVVERAATATSARRLRYTLVGVAAAAALLAGSLVAWNTLGTDGENVRVATAQATSAAAPATSESGNCPRSRSATLRGAAYRPSARRVEARRSTARRRRSAPMAPHLIPNSYDPEPISWNHRRAGRAKHMIPETDSAGCETDCCSRIPSASARALKRLSNTSSRAGSPRTATSSASTNPRAA